MILSEPFNKESLNSFLKDFLPDYQLDERSVRTPDKSILTEVTQLGASRKAEVTVLEAECEETDTNRRIAITQAAFKVLREHSIRNAIIAFHDGADQWRLSLLTSTLEIKDGKVVKKDSNPRRYSYLLGVGAKTVTPYKYLVEKGKVEDIKQLQERFSVEVVNKQFYASVADLFTKLVGGERGATKYPGLLKINSVVSQNVEHQEFAVRLIGRIIFSWFLKEKKSTAGVAIVPNELLSLDAVASNADYYHSILEPLFFELLNKRVENRHESLREAPFSTVPYLNGGLFSPQRGDFYSQNSFNGAGTPGLTHIPNEWFSELFTVLEQYNFTVDENTSYDVDLSIDPEMLGRIFENLLAEINPETGESARKSTGSFYTPREIVDYMVDSSLLEFLKTKTGTDESKLKALISWGQADDDEHPLSNDERQKIVTALAGLTILDPACGSGAFPIGILQKVVYILQQADPRAEIWLENQLKSIASPELKRDIQEKYESENYDWLRKYGVIRETIFGIDIQTIATEISKLRCFLTLIIEEEVDDDKPNRGVHALPNLDFKFVTANSLVSLPDSNTAAKGKGLNLFEDVSHIEQLKSIRNQYFGANADERARLQVEFKNLQMDMLRSRIASSNSTSDLYNELSDWDPFSHKATEWFDSEWMFGLSGFDIIIGNPPYVKNGRLSKKDKDRYLKLYSTPFDQWDLYILFFEHALNNLNSIGTGCLITPNQYLSAKYGTKLRKALSSRILSLTDFRNLANFDNASVNTFITIFKGSDIITDTSIIVFDSVGGNTKDSVKRTDFTDNDDNLGAMLSVNFPIVNRIIKNTDETIAKYYEVGHSFSIPDFYKLSPLIYENHTPNNEHEVRLVSTGTIGQWGQKPFKYEGKNYEFPVVKRADFNSIFPTRGIQIGPGLVISSMGGLKVQLDEKGEHLGTRPTMWLSPKEGESLKVIYAILNSKFINWFYTQQYSVAGMTGFKVRFGNIQQTPLPRISERQMIDMEQLVELGDQAAIDELVYELYGLSSEEIAIIEESTS